MPSAGRPLVILAGKEYGSGSSRDWAAKGPKLLGVRAVIAESYERIHRSNLVGMGILPLQFVDGQNVESLGLTGEEVFDFPGLKALLEAKFANGRLLKVKATLQTARRRSSRPRCGSIRRRRFFTTRTAAFCNMCCGSWLGGTRPRQIAKTERPRIQSPGPFIHLLNLIGLARCPCRIRSRATRRRRANRSRWGCGA